MMEWRITDRTLYPAVRPLVMGIVNVTPDSFSDGGRHSTTEAAVAHAARLVEAGADLLDVGGESTRPGAVEVSEDEELRRVLPVVRGLAGRVGVPLSIDTSKAAVAAACLEAGAHIINDVTGLTGDGRMVAVAREHGAGLVVMHMQGTPQTMQADPRYTDVVSEIRSFFQARLQALSEEGIAIESVALDPGIGFGKTARHNMEILAGLPAFLDLGRPLCLGVSRKGFLGRLLDRPVERRLAGSLAAVSFALGLRAVHIVRVHDVEETRDTVTLFTALQAVTAQTHQGSGRDGHGSSAEPAGGLDQPP